MSGFYNAMQLREVLTQPNWISDWKSWRYKRNFTLSSCFIGLLIRFGEWALLSKLF